LRWRIRCYVWLEGISLALVWLGLMFWIGFAFDYLPVLAGSHEMPVVARLLLLAVVAAGLGWVLWRYIFRRAFVALADRSLALLLERKFTQFDDSLLTSVELTGAKPADAGFDEQMLVFTEQEALGKTSSVRYAEVFNYRPIIRNVIVAVGLGISLALFFYFNTATANQAVSRLYLLDNARWPRLATIAVLGVELEKPPLPGSTTPQLVAVDFTDRKLKVARGTNIRLKVKADANAKTVPKQCTVYYQTQPTGDYPAERGRVILSKFRDQGDGRFFWSEGKPFVGMLSSVQFDVVGYDHRVSDFHIEVVESPAVIETTLDLKFPAYMVDEKTGQHLPDADQPYVSSGTSIPQGTDVTLKFKANKPLTRVEFKNVDTEQVVAVEVAKGAEQFNHHLPALDQSLALEVTLIDTDGVSAERPHRVFLTAVPDAEPRVEVGLKGIGLAVTPDVVIPLAGKVTDDYRVARAWLELQAGQADRQIPLALGTADAVDARIDFRELRSQEQPVVLQPKDKLTLSVQAADKFNLAAQPHVGVGDKWQIDVVTPAELLSQLEVRELGLRRRFEQVIDEMAQMRDSLVRVKASLLDKQAGKTGTDSDAGETPLTPEQRAEREKELRLLRVQRGGQQSEKSREESAGIAAAFLDIREELINNRVDTEERKERLKDQIAEPLRQVVSVHFAELDRRLAALEKQLEESAGPELTDAALEQSNEVLAELDKILQKMLDLETFNELIDLVRDLLKSQEDLLDRTKQERKRQALEDLK
jgi:hypothetical protein